VTQEQYEQVMGKNPSHSAKLRKPQNPVEMVSWHDAMEFCKTLSTKTGQTVRLPTEAQWEYACRAETTTRFFYGDDPWQMDDYAWYERNGSQQTHPVGEKKPNAWGVYDMEGNVWQWCFDWYADSYAHAKNEDPQGPDSGSKRVVRGAYYSVQTHWLRCASRGYSKPDDRLFTFIGFRVVVDVK
jgi:formylglycine-generating enzyme required for sulfatase activity